MNPAPALVLAIDLGSSGPKAALVRSDGKLVSAASRRVDTFRLPGGSAEQEAEGIWRAVLDAAVEVMSESKIGGGRVAGVAVTSQFSSIVPVDRQGLPLMNLILWMDRRGASYARQIYQRHSDALETWIEVTMASPGSPDALTTNVIGELRTPATLFWWFGVEQPGVCSRSFPRVSLRPVTLYRTETAASFVELPMKELQGFFDQALTSTRPVP